ncbi:MAG: type VI secretion system protein TssA, partial [Gemmatimonadetes bacterium]
MESTTTDVDLEALLAPLPGEAPAGRWTRYEGTYDAVEEARRADDPNAPRDIWTHELKAADWDEVERLCVDALTTKTKDFQIAAW